MSEPTHTNPVAVPWTPEMTGQNAPVAPQSVGPGQPMPPHPPQPYPAHSQPAYQGSHAQSQPQSPQAYSANPAAQHSPQQAPQPPVQYAQPQPVHQHAPAQPAYIQHGQPQSRVQPQQPYRQAEPAGTAQQPMQYREPGNSPPQSSSAFAPQLQQAAHQGIAEPAARGGLLSRLLKRSPRPDQNGHNAGIGQMGGRMAAHMPSQMQNAAAQVTASGQALSDVRPRSGSLFNKNFFLGAMTGLVVGAFVLPLIINTIAGDTSSQTQAAAQFQPPIEGALNEPLNSGEPTFLDAAISADES